MGLGEEGLLGVDAGLPRADSKPPDGALVDARQVEVADHLEGVVDALGELAELHEAAHDAAPEVDPRVAKDVGEAPPVGAIEVAVDAGQLRVEELVVVAKLEELRRGQLENVRNVSAARGLEHEGAIPVDDHQIVVEVAIRVLQHVFSLQRREPPVGGLAEHEAGQRRRREHLARGGSPSNRRT